MTTPAASPAHSAVAKAAWRLLPLLFLLYAITFVDRANIAVAALAMNADLRLSATAYGGAAGTFFLGYVVFQVPANAALVRFGAGRTLTVIILTCGMCAMATAFVTNAATLYVARFALGLAEAGLFPGVIAYLTLWFPRAQRARVIAAFFLAIPFANIVGLPLSGLIIDHIELPWLTGWRAMFEIEALPALVLAPFLRLLLPDNPQRASWLTAQERAELTAQLSDELAAPAEHSTRNPLRFAHFALIYSGLYFGLYSLQFFLPQLVSVTHGKSTPAAATLSALPYAVAAVAMLAWSWRSIDSAGARAGHVAIPAMGAAAAVLGAAMTPMSPTATLAWLTIAIAGILAALPAFWSRCTAEMAGPRAATAIAAINAVASLASFAGPYATGYLKDATGTYHLGLLLIAAALTAAAAGSTLSPRTDRRPLGDPHRTAGPTPHAAPRGPDGERLADTCHYSTVNALQDVIVSRNIDQHIEMPSPSLVPQAPANSAETAA